MTNKIIFGIDIGGTDIKCGVFSHDKKLLEKTKIHTRKEENGKYILEDIMQFVEKTLDDNNMTSEDVIGIGIGVPGSVMSDGTVNKCVNLGWGVCNIPEIMKKMTDIPVKVINDANAAALGESCCGAGKGSESMMMITLGTGVGGGLVIDGKPVIGFNGAAAEIGHMPLIYDENEYCNCGKKGCLEQAVSATGIVRTAKRFLDKSDKDSILRKIQQENGDITAKDVFDAAKSSDEIAIEVAEYVAEYLAKGLSCISAVVDPECFIIGGGVSAAGEYLFDLIRKYYVIHTFHPSRDTRILPAVLGNDAGMYGAVGLF